MKQTGAQGGVKQSDILEVTGPILPHHVQNLVQLLKDTQNSKFTITFNTHEPSVPLNVLTEDSDNESSPSSYTHAVPWESLGLDAAMHQSFVEQFPLSDRTAGIKELFCTDEGFSWVV